MASAAFITRKILQESLAEGKEKREKSPSPGCRGRAGKVGFWLRILELVDGVECYGDGVAAVVANQAVKVAFQGVIPADFQAG